MEKCGTNLEARNENITQRMLTACWKTKVTDTQSGYVTLTGKHLFAIPHKIVTRTLLYITFYAHCLPCHIAQNFFALNITNFVGVKFN